MKKPKPSDRFVITDARAVEPIGNFVFTDHTTPEQKARNAERHRILEEARLEYEAGIAEIMKEYGLDKPPV